MEPITFAVISGFVLLIVAAVVYGYYQAKKRREDLARIAAGLELAFDATDPYGIPGQYGHISALAQGHNRSAYNVVHGQRGPYQVKAFDYLWYTTESSTDAQGKTTTREVSHYLSAVIFDVDVRFPTLTVRPENFMDKIAAAIGFDDIDFESAEFSRKFFVKSTDKKFAYDVVHARMMEYLLAHPGWTLQLEGPVVFIQKGGFMKADQFSEAILFTDDFLKQIPEFVWKNLRGG